MTGMSEKKRTNQPCTFTACLTYCDIFTANKIITRSLSTDVREVFDKISTLSFGTGHANTCLMPYVNNKSADLPAHPRSLTSTFV